MRELLNAPHHSFSSIAFRSHVPHHRLSNYPQSPRSSLDVLHLERSHLAPEPGTWKSLISSMSCCLCSGESFVERETHSSLPKSKPVHCCSDTREADVKTGALQQHSWLQESWQLPGSHRKASAWTDTVRAGDEVYCRAPRWKQLLRKIRAEARNLNCAKQLPAFHYDAFSYAKNFDDGCWQECLSRTRDLCPMRFTASLVLETQSLNKKANVSSPNRPATKIILWRASYAKQQHTPSIWQRRRTTPAPVLHLKTARSRSALADGMI